MSKKKKSEASTAVSENLGSPENDGGLRQRQSAKPQVIERSNDYDPAENELQFVDEPAKPNQGNHRNRAKDQLDDQDIAPEVLPDFVSDDEDGFDNDFVDGAGDEILGKFEPKSKNQIKKMKAALKKKAGESNDRESCFSFNCLMIVLAVCVMIGGLLYLRLKDGLSLDDLDGTHEVRDQQEVNFYQLLQVAPDASPAKIKAAYRELALKWHPDKCQSDACESMFVQANKAYEVLSDPSRRAAYDSNRRDFEPLPSDAVDLTADNFDKLVVHSDELWIIQVYAEWAPAAVRFARKWEDEVGRWKSSSSSSSSPSSALPVKFGRIHASIQSDLFIRLPIPVRLAALPTVLSYFRARAKPWNRWTGTPKLPEWVRQEIPNHIHVVGAHNLAAYLGSLHPDETSVLLYPRQPQPVPSVYKALGLLYEDSIQFAIVHASEESDAAEFKAILPRPFAALPALLVSPPLSLSSSSSSSPSSPSPSSPSTFATDRMSALKWVPSSSSSSSSTLSLKNIAQRVHQFVASKQLLPMSDSSVRSLCLDAGFSCTVLLHGCSALPTSSSSASSTTEQLLQLYRSYVESSTSSSSSQSEDGDDAPLHSHIDISKSSSPQFQLICLMVQSEAVMMHISGGGHVIRMAPVSLQSISAASFKSLLASPQSWKALDESSRALFHLSLHRVFDDSFWSRHSETVYTALIVLVVLISGASVINTESGARALISTAIVSAALAMALQNETLFKILSGSRRAFDD